MIKIAQAQKKETSN